MLASTWQDLLGTQVAGRYILRDLVYAGRRQAEYVGAAVDDGEVPVSVALIEPEPGEVEQELAAIARAKQLQHPNLLHVLDGGECPVESTRMLYIVTEAAQGTLAEVRAAGPPPEPAALLEDLLAALEWLHAQDLIYRTLDPDTIVRVNGRWKLSDLSQVHSSGQFEPAPASRTAPPEAASGLVLPAWDSWTLGVLLRDLLPQIQPAPFDAIVRGCLEPDYQRRLTLGGIRRLLRPEPAPPAAAPARSRWLIVLIAAAVVLSIVVFALLLRHPRTTPPPAAVHPAPRAESKPSPPAPITPAAPRPSPFPDKNSPTPKAEAAPAATDQQTGRAEYFSDDLEGQLTASGERFSNAGMTAASRQFPIGTRLRVTNLKNRHSVTVRVNDRGPSRRGVIISVTRRAAEQLGFVKDGSARVRIQVLK